MEVYRQFDFSGGARSGIPIDQALFDRSSFEESAGIITDGLDFFNQNIGGVGIRHVARSAWTSNELSAIYFDGIYYFTTSAGSELIFGTADDGKLYSAAFEDTNWSVVGTAVAAAQEAAGGMFKQFSDAGVPVLLYKDSRAQKQLRYYLSSLNAVASVYGTVLGVYDNRSWLSEFSTGGSGGVQDRVFYSDIGDQQTYGGTSYIQVGTNGYQVTAMNPYRDNFHIASRFEMHQWDTYQLRKLFDYGVKSMGDDATTKSEYGVNSIVTIGDTELFVNVNSELMRYDGEGLPSLITESAYIPFGFGSGGRLTAINGLLVASAVYGGTLGIYNPRTNKSVSEYSEDSDGVEPVCMMPTNVYSVDTNVTNAVAFIRNDDDATTSQVYLFRSNYGGTKQGTFGTDYIENTLTTHTIYGNTYEEMQLVKRWDTLNVYFNNVSNGETGIKVTFYTDSQNGAMSGSQVVLRSGKMSADGRYVQYKIPKELSSTAASLTIQLLANDDDQVLLGYELFYEVMGHANVQR